MELDWRTDSSESDVISVGGVTGSEVESSERDGSDRYGSERDDSERDGSERDGSERYASERDGSEREISDRDGSEREMSDREGSERDGSERYGSERDGSGRDGSERYGSERNGSEREMSDRDGSERDGSERDGSERYGSEREISDRDGSEREGSEREGSERDGSEVDHSERASSDGDAELFSIERYGSERDSSEDDPDWVEPDPGSEESRDLTETQDSASTADFESTLRELEETVASEEDTLWTQQDGSSSERENEDSVASLHTRESTPARQSSNDDSNPASTDRDGNSLENEPSEAEELPEVTIPEAERGPSPRALIDQPTTSRARERSPGGPPAKIRKKSGNTDVGDASDPDDDGVTCSICLDSWSTSGEHRIVALKCGHLFGRSCVVRWLTGHAQRERRCPTCKARAAQRDIRCIYARKLVAADTSEIDSLKRQLEETKSERTKVQLELQSTQMRQRMYEQQLKEMRALTEQLKSKRTERKPGAQTWHFTLEKSLEVASDASCRALAYNCRKYELYASQRSTAALFPGYGIRKVDCVNFKLGQFVYAHPKAIRDMQYSAVSDQLLTVGLDGAAKLICGHSGQVAGTIRTDMPLWSCCWDRVQPTRLFVGGPGGVTLSYDTRNTNTPVERTTVPSDVSPVVSLASTPDGFLSCHLNSCWFYRRVGAEYRPLMLPFDGPFLSLRYEEQSRQVLISCRPTANKPSRHIVAQLELTAGAVDCNALHTFSGSSVQTLMARSCQMRIGDEDWIAAHSESAGSVMLYNTNSLRLMQSLTMREPVVDMCPMSFNGNNFLATLSQNKARIYKANVASC